MTRFAETPSRAPLPRGPLLAIDWTETSITVLHVPSASRGAPFGARVELLWPDELRELERAAEAGRWLKQALRAHGIPLLPAVVCAPRRRGFLKLLEVPPVAPGLMPDVVRSQAEHRTGTEAGQMVIDFLTLPAEASTADAADPPLRPVLAALLPGQVIESIRTTLAAAEIPVAAIGFGELALPSLEQADGRLRLHILCVPERTELVLGRNGFPLGSQSLPGATSDDAIEEWLPRAERMRAALPATLQAAAIEEIVLWGSGGAACAPIGNSAGIPVRAGSIDSDNLRAAAYLASLRSPPKFHRPLGTPAIDFVHPRRSEDPAVARNRLRRRAALWAAAVVAPLGVWFHLERSSLDHELAGLRRHEREQQKLLERGQPLVAAAGFLDHWKETRTDWGTELTRLLPLLPTGDRGFLNRLQLEQREGERASVQISGLARSADEIARLNTRLVQGPEGYDLQPRAIEPNSLDPEFQVRFHTDLSVRPAEERADTETGDVPQEGP